MTLRYCRTTPEMLSLASFLWYLSKCNKKFFLNSTTPYTTILSLARIFHVEQIKKYAMLNTYRAYWMNQLVPAQTPHS
jgi:hypothetical protein